MLVGGAALGLGQGATETSIKISSPDFSDGGNIPARFTCTGENVNPSLQISGVPAVAKSLVIIVDDPDAPTGTWTHWLLWNLKPDLKEIPVNSVPAGTAQGVNDFHKNNYSGPCPPSGTHRYFFRVYALDMVLELPASANRKALDKAISGHVLAHSEWMGKYAKPK